MVRKSLSSGAHQSKKAKSNHVPTARGKRERKIKTQPEFGAQQGKSKFVPSLIVD